MNNALNFLEFQGKEILYTFENDKYWVAIKPICDALEVNYVGQFKQLKNHDIYSQLLYQATIVAADSRKRKMMCLPEKFVYTWMLGIQSPSPGLREYKLLCHDILYEYFRGSLTDRREVISKKSISEKRLYQLELQNRKNPEFIEWLEEKENLSKIKKQLKALDEEIQSNQSKLF